MPLSLLHQNCRKFNHRKVTLQATTTSVYGVYLCVYKTSKTSSLRWCSSCFGCTISQFCRICRCLYQRTHWKTNLFLIVYAHHIFLWNSMRGLHLKVFYSSDKYPTCSQYMTVTTLRGHVYNKYIKETLSAHLSINLRDDWCWTLLKWQITTFCREIMAC